MKWISFLSLIFLFVSCANETNKNYITFDTKSIITYSDEIKLLHASSMYTSYRGAGSQAVKLNILVKKSDSEKEVVVHLREPNEEWSYYNASYLKEAAEGYEIWSFYKSYCSGYTCGPQDYGVNSLDKTGDVFFAVKLISNGSEYWDNNSGNNYHFSRNDGHLLTSPEIYHAEKGNVVNYSYIGKRVLQGKVVVKNIAADKDIKVIYSSDGWNTVHAGSTKFLEPHQVNTVYTSVENPNIHGTEVWGFGEEGYGIDLVDIPDAIKIEYKIQYTVDGQTYIDDNFGHNYTVGAPLYGVIHLRGTFNDWNTYGSMMARIDENYNVYYESSVEFDGRGDEDGPDRFKLDVSRDWSHYFGEDDNNGYSKEGTAEVSGGDIYITEGPGRYTINFEEVSRKFKVTKDNYQPTIVLIHGISQPGQDMFIRGGIDHDYAASIGKTCTKENMECAIPIRHKSHKNNTTSPWKNGDSYLDWYGSEEHQRETDHGAAKGSPLDWTTDEWPSEWGETPYYKDNGYGVTDINTFGMHYWILNVDMDCTKTIDGWFELKSYISNGPGWESDISQSDTPYESRNHFAKCGQLNVFNRNKDEPVTIEELTFLPDIY